MVATAFCVLLAALAGPQEPPKREYARGIVLVQLRVGDAPGWAMIDTGSPHTYVDSSFKDTLSPNAPNAKAAVTQLWIGGKFTVKQEVRFLDLSPFDGSAAKRPLIAIVGRDVLGGYAIGIDYKRGMMKLWKGGRVSQEAVRSWAQGKEKGAMSVDVHVDKLPDFRPEILVLDLGVEKETGAWTLDCRPGAAAPVPLHFDTGSTITSIHWKQLDGLALKLLRAETVADVFGASVRRVMLLPQLAVGELRLKDVEVYVEEEGTHADVLAPKDLGVQWYILDPVAGKLYLPVGSQ